MGRKPSLRRCSLYRVLGSLLILLWIVAYGVRYGFPSFHYLKSTIFSYNVYTPFGAVPPQLVPEKLGSVEDLVAAIESSTIRAAGGRELEAFILTGEETIAWEVKNPCRSRSELNLMYKARKYALDIESNPRWVRVIDEYAKLHSTCLQKVGNVTEYFLKGNSSTGCKFLLLQTPKVGLGNKLLLKASAILFAVLTQRVLLIPSTSVEQLCEPFFGSSWSLDEHSSIQDFNSAWHGTGDFQMWVDHSEIRIATSRSITSFPTANLNDPFQPMIRFYCDTEQAYLSKVTWISVGGCLYFLPKLFAIPAFRPALEDLFPDRMALTHILRSVLLPADHVWERISVIKDVYLDHYDKLIGVQLRFFGLQSQYRQKNDLVNKNVLQCAYANGYLPQVLASGVAHPFPKNTRNQRNITKVFIASLFPGLHDFLKKIYVRQATGKGEGVGMVQLTSENEQHFGAEVDVEAFVEIMFLSFSDALFITPWSTFGGAAQAYGGLKPWFINYDNDGPPCTRAQTVDVCFDQASEDFLCPHDPELHRKSLLSYVPYIKRCLKDDADGVQLITNHESNLPLFHKTDM